LQYNYFSVMTSVAVFCGSSKGKDSGYAEQARLLGIALARRGHTIVYGGGHVGLMGVIADAALSHGGRVIGVITEHLLAREVCHTGLSELYVVPTMHERKVLMAQLSDAVIAAPGGFGTLDELYEMLTLAQLGHDHRPIGLLNTLGYFDYMLRHLDHMVVEGFLRKENRLSLMAAESIESLLEAMSAYDSSPEIPKWL
jgi:uncharacterized protein (TIGR00730 family)